MVSSSVLCKRCGKRKNALTDTFKQGGLKRWCQDCRDGDHDRGERRTANSVCTQCGRPKDPVTDTFRDGTVTKMCLACRQYSKERNMRARSSTPASGRRRGRRRCIQCGNVRDVCINAKRGWWKKLCSTCLPEKKQRASKARIFEPHHTDHHTTIPGSQLKCESPKSIDIPMTPQSMGTFKEDNTSHPDTHPHPLEPADLTELHQPPATSPRVGLETDYDLFGPEPLDSPCRLPHPDFTLCRRSDALLRALIQCRTYLGILPSATEER